MGRIRTVAGFVLAAVVLVVCVACEDGSVTTSTTGSSGGPQEITWERAVRLVGEGRVAAVAQYHSLKVEIRLIDGTEYWTTEPQIDAIFGVVEDALDRFAPHRSGGPLNHFERHVRTPVVVSVSAGRPCLSGGAPELNGGFGTAGQFDELDRRAVGIKDDRRSPAADSAFNGKENSLEIYRMGKAQLEVTQPF